MLDTFADDEQFALESILIGNFSTTPDKDLAHYWLYRAGGISDIAVVAWYIAPAE